MGRKASPLSYIDPDPEVGRYKYGAEDESRPESSMSTGDVSSSDASSVSPPADWSVGDCGSWSGLRFLRELLGRRR